jgi:hypothetical protein
MRSETGSDRQIRNEKRQQKLNQKGVSDGRKNLPRGSIMNRNGIELK